VVTLAPLPGSKWALISTNVNFEVVNFKESVIVILSHSNLKTDREVHRSFSINLLKLLDFVNIAKFNLQVNH
jgi:hypothetical protein